MMRFEELLVALSFCLFLVVRLKKGPRPYHGVRVPLVWNWGEGWDSKAISVEYVVGGPGGRPVHTMEEAEVTGIQCYQRLPR